MTGSLELRPCKQQNECKPHLKTRLRKSSISKYGATHPVAGPMKKRQYCNYSLNQIIMAISRQKSRKEGILALLAGVASAQYNPDGTVPAGRVMPVTLEGGAWDGSIPQRLGNRPAYTCVAVNRSSNENGNTRWRAGICPRTSAGCTRIINCISFRVRKCSIVPITHSSMFAKRLD